METVTSFRALTDTDRPKIKEARLRIVKAREGETLEELERRVNSEWLPVKIAVVNGLPQQSRLKEGQLIKVAILQPYRPNGAGR